MLYYLFPSESHTTCCYPDPDPAEHADAAAGDIPVPPDVTARTRILDGRSPLPARDDRRRHPVTLHPTPRLEDCPWAS